MGSARWVQLTVVTIYATEGLLVAMFPAFLHERGVTAGLIGSAGAMFFLTSLLSRLPIGMIYTGSRARGLMIASLVVMSITSTLYGFAVTPALVLGLRGVHGFAYGVATTVNLAMFFEVGAIGTTRIKAMAVFSAALSAGKMLGATVGGWVAEFWSFQAAFVLAGLFTVSGVWFTLMVRLESDQPAAVKTPATDTTHWWVRVRNTSPLVWVSTAMQFHLNVVRSMWEAFFSVYALSIGISVGMIGLMRGLDNLFGMFSRVLVGELGRFASPAVLTHMGVTSSGLLVTAQTFVTGALGLGAIVLMLSLTRAVATVTASTGAMKGTQGGSDKGRGMGAAVLSVGKDLGNVLGPALGGLLGERYGVVAMLRYAPLGILAVYGVLMIWFRQLWHKDLQTDREG